MNSKGQLEPPPGNFLSPLLELRDYYARLTEEYERLFVEARSQLDHVEALLSTWSFADGNKQISRLKAADETANSSPEASLRFLSAHDDISQINLTESIESELTDSEEIETNPSSTVDRKAVHSPTTFTDIQTPPENNDNSGKVPDIPMLPKYQSLSRMEAIKQLLQEQSGTVCHIDFIVRSLYGDLDSNLFRVVKGRVQSSLTQGRERNYWVIIPEEPGCYTLDLSLVAPKNGNGASRSIKSKRKKPFIPPNPKTVPMLKAYEGQFLIDALTSLFEKNPGKVFTVAEVIGGIYGELTSGELREIKNKVLNELSRGYRTGRFSKVPDQIGLYTWDSNMISEGNYRN
ncbi:MAG: hypothetical protein RMY62_023335 [Nostoc sp. ZfuVER08]|uniref:Uncharacterized protein n=1 Tax=Nostoc punctiforme FACHB-252 TaxID=1357509 RepID=A0ABR8H7U2_NOSPU|nr:hypothetical protein [Nostoc punctiforme]MBD2611564.1 hypothetical protein [Nostoc punctiforme FACHB-252]MDZ8014057.1 hypothetical protein [Nostoc sp. ZfuVER08]